MNRKLEMLIDKHNLSYLKQEILESVYERIAIKPVAAGSLPTGTSKFGGIPDLPGSLEYPLYKNTPLNFIGQINLAELSQLRFTGSPMPATGMLYFFYYDNWEEDGELVYGEPDEKDGWRVLYWEGNVAELNPVKQAKTAYPQCKMNFSIQQRFSYILLDTEEEELKFDLLHNEWHGYLEHQILGTPLSIQGEVFEETCEYVDAEKEDMVLLLQVDTDEENLNMLWGDCGMLYYCISKDDLSEKRFDRTWFSFQCH